MEALSHWLADRFATLQEVSGLLFAVGIVSLVLTLVTLPIVIVRLPADYFVRDKRVALTRSRLPPLLGWLASTAKNLVGVLLIGIGFVLLFVPGQGLLTMLIGLMLTNFPGKYRLERRIVRRPSVLRTLNRIRRRAGRAALTAPAPGE